MASEKSPTTPIKLRTRKKAFRRKTPKKCKKTAKINRPKTTIKISGIKKRIGKCANDNSSSRICRYYFCFYVNPKSKRDYSLQTERFNPGTHLRFARAV